MAIAVAFVDVAVHVDNGGLLIGGGALIAALALTAEGPLGIVRICSRSLHLVLAIVVGVAVAVAPVVPALRPDVEGIIVVEFGAIGLIRLASLTAASSAGVRSRRIRTGTPVIEATATVVAPDRPDPAGPGTVTAPTGPPSPAPTGSGPPAPQPPGAPGEPLPGGVAARWAGRTVGQAGATGKKAAAVYGPVAGARLKRAIRSAGRSVGRAGGGHQQPGGTDPGTDPGSGPGR